MLDHTQRIISLVKHVNLFVKRFHALFIASRSLKSVWRKYIYKYGKILIIRVTCSFCFYVRKKNLNIDDTIKFDHILMWTFLVKNIKLWEQNEKSLIVCPFTIITTYTNRLLLLWDLNRCLCSVDYFVKKYFFYYAIVCVCVCVWKNINIWHNRSHNPIEILSFWFFLFYRRVYVYFNIFLYYLSFVKTWINSPPLQTRFYCHRTSAFIYWDFFVYNRSHKRCCWYFNQCCFYAFFRWWNVFERRIITRRDFFIICRSLNRESYESAN